jgi:hypothetical protein
VLMHDLCAGGSTGAENCVFRFLRRSVKQYSLSITYVVRTEACR